MESAIASGSLPVTSVTPEISLVPPAPKRSGRQEWISRYIEESHAISNGEIDIEITSIEGDALQRVVGHRLPEEVARQHFNSYTGADSGFIRVEEKFQALAVRVGITKDGQPLSKEMLDFAYGVATLCACAADRFRDAREGSAGDHIRGLYGPVPF
ncbi:hypothetical protein SAMN05518854_117101 [Variovorax sp. YR266]|uniref:hypothetical protein n=1 Tax=Variovorax sp. YR266 TaxID=1884386 RepID=UPI0008992E4B|nr:hypothetical protein [Variovorax sp. YR266]SDZ71351.1 hypothetical protein SAMN05518854_117101 [Variovorax sp. YR266]